MSDKRVLAGGIAVAQGESCERSRGGTRTQGVRPESLRAVQLEVGGVLLSSASLLLACK